MDLTETEEKNQIESETNEEKRAKKKRRRKRGRPKKTKREKERKRIQPPFQVAYRELLKREGFTQKTLADALGVHPSVVCRDLKRPNYIDPKLREYVEMLGYRIVLSFEKVGEPNIVKHERMERTIKAMETVRENKLRQTYLGKEMSESQIVDLAGKYGSTLKAKEVSQDTEPENEMESIAHRYGEISFDV